MSDRDKKPDKITKGLNNIVAEVYEMDWQALVIVDTSYEYQGVIIGPKQFVEDFKKFREELNNLEDELMNALQSDESKSSLDKLTDDSGDDNDGDDSGGTVH